MVKKHNNQNKYKLNYPNGDKKSGNNIMSDYKISQLKQLEAESIEIFRDAVSQFENPIMLYSIGKDSSVLVRLAQKAFFPGKLPFKLLHINSTWKFKEMIAFRDKFCAEQGFDLIEGHNAEGKAAGVNPFDYGSRKYTDIMKTQALLQYLDKGGYDVAFGGARRDEEKSRAKERIYSFRDRNHQWDPKNQRPELWNLYNGRINPGESVRVFPISNWTELDVWQYIRLEKIPLVPLYFAKKRPVVKRDGTWIMVDDERMRLEPGEIPVEKMVRFRTLGCYPLTGAIESSATTVEDIVTEMMQTRLSERSTRLIDSDGDSSMEQKKREGYF
jgi:sulfate adenylyltransferase subunit 2